MKVTLIVLAHLALAYGADPFACPRPDYWGDCICDPTEQSLICSNSPDEIKFWPDKDASWSPFKLIVLDGFKIEAEIKLSDNTKLKSTGLKLTNSLVKDFGSIATILKDVTSVVLDNVLTEDSKQIKLSDLTDKLTVVKLTTFEVTNSQLDDTQMPDVSTWAELQILSLNGNKFTKLNDKIKGLKKLTTVNLQNNALANADAGALSFATDNKLTLRLDQNKINTKFLIDAKLENAKELDVNLAYNVIEKFTKEPFESLDNNLYKINLPNNNITCTYDDCDWAFHLKDPAPVPYEHLLNVECVNNHKQLFNLREQDLPGFPTPAPPTPSTPSPPPTTPHSTPEPPTPKPSDVEVKVGNQWLEIKRELWPYVDSEDSIHNTPTDFFIIHPGDINFKSITKDVLPGSENVKFPVKLSFKYWAHEAIATTYIEKNKKDTIIDKISKEYINFDSYWLYREYILTELQLKSYDFWTALDQYSVIALKDIKIEYTTVADTPVTLGNHNYINNTRMVYHFTKNDIQNNANTIVEKDIINKCKIKTNTDYNKNCFHENINQNGKNAIYQIKVDSPKDNDVCFELKYLLIKSKITPATIDIHYNVDPTEFAAEKNKIFTFTPMVKLTTTDKDIETYAFCLRDVLALSAENLLITFVANTGGADGDDTLALSIDYKPKAKDPWKFTSNKFIQTFNDKESSFRSYTDLFTYKDNVYTFTGKPVTEIPTTAHLMGPWIQYNSNLGNGLNEYSVTVKQEKVFNAFTIRPKICTDLSQCFDVNAIGVKADSSGLTRVYTFNFDAIEDKTTHKIDTDLVKLVFFVDYFMPENFKPDENISITFDLKLLNFGDPVYERTVSEILKCDKTGTNFGYKSNPTMDNPNHCICNDGYYGAKCDQLAKPIEVKVEPPKKGDWGEQASPKVGFYPTKKGPLIFNFKDINADMFDICPTIEYTVTEPKALMKLTVQYSEGSASPDTPVDTSTYIDEVLKKTPEKGNAFTFCVSDLRNKPQKTFSVVITAEATATKPEDQIYDATTLTITKFSATKIPINRPNFIQNVDIKHKQYWTEQKWHTMSVENNFIPSKDKTSHQLKVMVKAKAQPIVSYFISDWIIVSDVKTFKPTISFKLGDIYTNLKIEQGVIAETNKQIPTQFVEIAYDKKLKTFTDQEIAADIPNTAQQIKLFLKFTFTADTNKDTNFDVTINSLSVFNPCPSDTKKCCNNKGACTLTDDERIYQCDCKDAQGRSCEKLLCKNTKLCNSYPIIPDFNAKNPLDRPNCEIIHTETPPKDTETCICPQTQFKSITGKAGCESKKNYKYNNEKPCKKDGSNIKCDIFTATDQQWYDTYQVSHADKYFPLYSPTKVADELSIEFSNLRAEEDVCFTLNYYSSGTSTITVTSAEPKSVGLLLNSLVDIPQWNQQYICGSYLTHAYTAAKAVKINIKGSDIHAGINIGPVLAIRNTFIDEPVLSHYNNKVIETAIKTEWPIVIGLKDNWIYDEKNNDNVKFAIKATEKPSETKYTTYLMSKWIAASGEHSLLRLQLDPKKEMKGFTIEFVVFDQNMQEVADPNRLVYGDKTFDTKTIIDTIDGDGAIEVQLPAKNQKVIRVGMKVVYKEDKTAKPLFTVSKISVNDPCITVDKYKIIPNLCGEYSSDKLCYPLTKAVYNCKCLPHGDIQPGDCTTKPPSLSQPYRWIFDAFSKILN